MVFHDDTLKRAIPESDGVNTAPIAALQEGMLQCCSPAILALVRYLPCKAAEAANIRYIVIVQWG